MTVSMAEADASTFGDGVKSYIGDVSTVNIGTLNTVLDTTTGASYDRINGSGYRVAMFPIGIQAAPAQGDPCFVCELTQTEAMTEVSSGSVLTISAKFAGWSNTAASVLYANPWGRLLHAKAAETAVNTAVGIDDTGASSTAGGYMMYQLFTSNGTVTLKTQDAATNTNPSFADLVASGSLNASVTPAAGIVTLSKTATVRRYLRWQLVLGTATTATFALAFVRA
jgi:hypothetical protein